VRAPIERSVHGSGSHARLQRDFLDQKRMGHRRNDAKKVSVLMCF
jgi:hypothetical protein